MNDNCIEFKIINHVATLTQHHTGWNKELNIVSWGDKDPLFDIRDWKPDYTQMTKGITMKKQQLENLKNVLDDFLKPDMDITTDFTDECVFELSETSPIEKYCKVFREVGKLEEPQKNGFTLEVNIASWNDSVPKLDIRKWDESHKRMSEGITLHQEEAKSLLKALKDISDWSFNGII